MRGTAGLTDYQPRPGVATAAGDVRTHTEPRLQRRSQRPRLWRRMLWRLRDLLLIAIDTLELAILRPSHAPQAVDGKPRLAVIFVHGIGDLVLFLGGLEDLVRSYRANHRITLVCWSTARAFAEVAVPVDEIMDVDRVRLRRDPRYRWSVMREIAKAGFAVAFQPNFNRDLLIEDALMRATGAPQRIGSAGTPMFIASWARMVGDRWYTKLVPASPTLMHDTERYTEFGRALGISSVAARPQLRKLTAPAETPRQPYILFAVGSSSPLKSWPLHNFEWVASAVLEHRDIRTVFTAGRGDRLRIAASPLREHPRFVDRIGRTDMAEPLSLIQEAELVVSNDSAAVHLAVALGIPSVCILGGGIVGRYLPYPIDPARIVADPTPVSLPEPMACFNCGWMCQYDLGPDDPAPCVERVERKAVLQAVLARLPRR
jgi:ADP-heptose:LPS heptosyltransferase